MNVLRIYFALNRAEPDAINDYVADALDKRGVQGWTLFPARGGWEREHEPALVLEVIGTEHHHPALESIIELARSWGENAILTTTHSATAVLLEGLQELQPSREVNMPVT